MAEQYYYDDKAAQKVIIFFEQLLVHTKGRFAGKPFILEPWEREFIKNVYGWKRKSNNTRKYRVAYLEIPKKNGKSAFASGLAAYMTFADGEMGAEVFSAAGDRAQAGIVFRVARDMIERSPQLNGRCECFASSIYVPKSNSRYEVLNAEAGTKHGINASAIIFDEFHVQKKRDLHDTLVGSVAFREQPLTIYITTAGWDRTSICWEYHQYARKVLEGSIVDEEFYPVIYAADPEGITVQYAYMEKEAERAKRVPGRQNAFKRLHLNIWTEQSERWLDLDEWRSLATQLRLEDMTETPVWTGLDLSSTRDLTALALLWAPEHDDDHWKLIPRFYMPKDNLVQRDEESSGNYLEWVQQGWIIATPGNVVDQDFIRKDIESLGLLFPIRELALDRWNSTYLMTQLQEEGLDVVPFGQGFASMSGPSKEFEKIILGKELIHDGNPVMDWMISNVALKEDAAGNIKPDKSRSSEKIDGVVSTIMALGRAISKDSLEGGPSVYEERGITFL